MRRFICLYRNKKNGTKQKGNTAILVVAMCEALDSVGRFWAFRLDGEGMISLFSVSRAEAASSNSRKSLRGWKTPKKPVSPISIDRERGRERGGRDSFFFYP